MPISTPDKIITPWATSGLKDDIPENADPVNGRAGFDQGFPAINFAPRTAGGIPPFGQDFNGIFFDVTRAIQFLQAGGSFPYDSEWAAAVGGYPIGALVSRTDNQGLWRNTVANNLTDPESGGAGWQPEGAGATTVAMSSSNVTLTPLQAASGIIIITGALTANLQLIFPGYVKQWLILNNSTGPFSITCRTVAGTGVTAAQNNSTLIYGDGNNIGASAQTGFDYLNTTRIDVASSSNINLNVASPNTRHINITGGVTINGFTISAGQCYFVRFGSACVLANSASLVTQSGSNIATAAGDTCIIRATADNVVEILCYTPGIPQAIGYRQTTQAMGSARVLSTDYTNTTGRPILISVYAAPSASNILNLFINGSVVAQNTVNNATSGANSTLTWLILPGQVYRVTSTLAALAMWTEVRV